MLKDGAIVEERYVVEGKLGEGGLAAVFRVRHRKLGTTYALKLLKRDSADVRRRLMREGELQARLRHPNIASVIDVVEVNGSPGLVMEFVRGSSLDVLLHYEDLSLDQIDHLAEGILRGLAVAHEAGTIHRDLKPANVLLEVVDGVLTPKITDFGLAKAMDGFSDTAVGVMMGTPQYMPPEQIEDASSVGSAADVWAMGVMLYEMVAGVRPFDAERVPDVLQLVLDGRRKPVGEVAPHVPMNRQRAIESALCMDPADRPSVKELLSLWVGERSHRPVVAFPSSVLERAKGRGAGAALPAETPLSPALRREEPDATFAALEDFGALAPAQEAQPEPRPLRGWLVGTGAAVVLALVVVGVPLTVGGAFLLGRVTYVGDDDGSQFSLPVSPPPVVTAPDPVAPEPPPVRPSQPEPRPQPKTRPRPARPAPPSEPEGDPQPPAPAPVPAPSSPPPATVRIQGDAGQVRFVGGERPLDNPTTLPPGTYDVHASMGGGPVHEVYRGVQVGAGQSVWVNCNAITGTCRVKVGP